jgi:hypothetical protein
VLLTSFEGGAGKYQPDLAPRTAVCMFAEVNFNNPSIEIREWSRCLRPVPPLHRFKTY